VVGVGEEDGDGEIVGEVALAKSFNRGLGADGHENGGFDGAVGGVEETGAGAGVGAFGHHFESNLAQFSG